LAAEKFIGFFSSFKVFAYLHLAMSTMHGAHPIPRFSERPPDLSSRKEIEDGIELATRVYESELVKVAFITDSVVVKYGSRVQLWEAQNMHHVASLPHMRVPKVFDAWETEEIGYIVMEYIDGRSLRDIWPVIPLDQRLDIYRQTQSMIEVLRQHKLSQPGPIGGGPSNRQTFFTEEGAGPVDSQSEIEGWFNERFHACKGFNRRNRGEPWFNGHFNELVMCHLDLHTGNLLLDKQGKIWLIDWEYSGAYPPYFEEIAVPEDQNHPDFTQGLLRTIKTQKYEKDIERLDFALSSGVLCTRSGTCTCAVDESDEAPDKGVKEEVDEKFDGVAYRKFCAAV
jgi:serine/threonine protein kinase